MDTEENLEEKEPLQEIAVEETPIEIPAGEEIKTPSSASDENTEEVTQEETPVELPETPEAHPKPVPNETSAEFALRKEVERLRGKLRSNQTKEIFTPAPPGTKKPLSPDKQKVLEKYDPAELNNLRELIDVMADDMGFIKKEELTAQTYNSQADSILNDFLDDHKEYLPENDPEGILWNQFREEFSLYKQPENPKEYKKLFSKVHDNIFGMKPTGDIKKINAQRQKIAVASHAGASSSAISSPKAVSNLRTDKLIGFSDEEIKDMGL